MKINNCHSFSRAAVMQSCMMCMCMHVVEWC